MPDATWADVTIDAFAPLPTSQVYMALLVVDNPPVKYDWVELSFRTATRIPFRADEGEAGVSIVACWGIMLWFTSNVLPNAHAAAVMHRYKTIWIAYLFLDDFLIPILTFRKNKNETHSYNPSTIELVQDTRNDSSLSISIPIARVRVTSANDVSIWLIYLNHYDWR